MEAQGRRDSSGTRICAASHELLQHHVCLVRAVTVLPLEYGRRTYSLGYLSAVDPQHCNGARQWTWAEPRHGVQHVE